MRGLSDWAIDTWPAATPLLVSEGFPRLPAVELLAALGIYSVMAHVVTQRTREIGIRMALGAGRHDVIALVVRRAMRRVAMGAVGGVLGAVALSRVMSRFLYEVSTTDLSTFAGCTLVLMLIALAAGYVSARRATGVDPIAAVRND